MKELVCLEAFAVAISRMTVLKLEPSDGGLTQVFGLDGFTFFVPDAIAQKLAHGELIALVYIPDRNNSSALEVLALIREDREGKKTEMLMGEDQGMWVRLYKMKARSLK